MAKRKPASVDDFIRPSGSDEQCAPGSIEQQLDMCEGGELRGDEAMRAPRREPIESNYQVDMSEENREGAEETGDEHSRGLQGEEQQELQYDDEIGESDAGVPGEMTNKIAHVDPSNRERHHHK